MDQVLIPIDDLLNLVGNTIDRELEITYKDEVLTHFIQNYVPDSLGAFISHDDIIISNEIDSIPEDAKYYQLMIIIKSKGQITDVKQIETLIIPINNSEDNDIFDKIRSIINFGLIPIFESSSLKRNVDSDSFINVTRKKFNELSLSLQNLQEKIQVPDLLLSVHPMIKQYETKVDVFEEELLNDSKILNEVTSIVNGWIKQIQAITNLSSDINSQVSISDEIQFWTSLDISLTSLADQLNSVQIQNSINLLNNAKRFHVILSFNNDTNLAEKDLETKLNLSLLKDLPITELTSVNSKDPDCFENLELSISNVFTHLKKLRTVTNFPLEKALLIIELFLKDVEAKFNDLLSNMELLTLRLDDFITLNETSIANIFNTIDLNVKYMINLIRELTRKRHEKFILVRIDQEPINKLKSKIDSLKDFRLKHENLLFVIRNFLRDFDQESKLLEEYNRLSSLNPFDNSKHGQVMWTSSEIFYNTIHNDIQNSITLKLNKLFAKCDTIQDYSIVAEKYKYLAVENTFNISVLTKEDLRMKILEKARDEISEIIRFDTQYGDKLLKDFSMFITLNESSDGSEVKATMARILGIRDKLTFYEDNLITLVGDEWFKYSIGNKVAEQITGLKSKFDPEVVFTDFLDSLVAFTSENKIEIRGKVLKSIETNGENDVVLNYDNKFIAYKEILLHFVSLGFKVPPNLLLEFQKISSLLPIVNNLKENFFIIKNLFLNVLKKPYGQKFEFLIEEDKSSIEQYLNLIKDLNWEYLSQALELRDVETDDSLIEIKSYQTVMGFQQSIEKLNIKLSTISKLHYYLEREIYQQLKACKYNYDEISSIISDLKTKVSGIYTFENISGLCKLIDEEIMDILNERMERELLRFMDEISLDSSVQGQYAVEVSIISGYQNIMMEPKIDDLKATMINKINQIISIVCRQKSLSENNCTVVNESVSKALSKAIMDQQLVIDEVYNHFNKWQTVNSLISLNLDSEDDITKFSFDDSLNHWYDSISRVLSLRSMFYNNKVMFGNVLVDLTNIQTRMSFRFDNFQRSIIKKFADIFQKAIHDFDDVIINATKLLSFNTMDSANFILNLSKFIETKEAFGGSWKQNHDLLVDSSKMLQKFGFVFPTNWTFVEQIDNNLSVIESIINKKQSIIEENFEFIKSRIIGQTNELSETILRFKDDWYSKRPISGDANPTMILNSLKNFESTCNGYISTKESLMMISEYFKIEIPDIEIQVLLDVQEEIKNFHQVWSSINALNGQIQSFKKLKWSEVKPRDIRIKLENLLEESRSLPIKVRQYAAFDDIQQNAKDLMKQNKYLIDLKNENLKDRHWKKLLSSIGYQGKSFQLFNLGDIWDLNLPAHEAIIKSIISQANNEHTLQENIGKIKGKWQSLTFDMFNFNSRVKLIKSWDFLFETCSQDLNELESMRNSASYHAFEQDVNHLEFKLNSFYVLLDIWIEVQRQWVYLEGVFEARNNIANILPLESSRFNNFTYEFLDLMKKVSKIELAIDVLLIGDIETTLERLLDNFSKLRRSLAEFLDKQREQFARFYFIGNDDLLELIGSGNDFIKINFHINKLFYGVSNVGYDTDRSSIVFIESNDGEKVHLETPVSLIKFPNLLEWLKQLDLEIKLTLSSLIKTNIQPIRQFYQSPSREIILKLMDDLPSQVVSVCTQIVFTEFRTDRQLKVEDIQEIIVLLGDIPSTSALGRKKVESLMIELIHQKDVFEQFGTANAERVLATELCYKYDMNSSDPLKALKVQQLEYVFDYGFEYLGIPAKLVYTPLISKCFAAMTQALGQKLGGSPFGPAGTGKTETIKALGGYLGRMVTVFCCDETFDYQSMSRIFLGICKLGCWGCFDEFNRLDEKLLSAVSSQIESIEYGLKHSTSIIEVSGQHINVNSDAGIFITMNPGYVGRNQLPENLKKLFRSFSMERPDKDIIVDVILASQGFKNSRSLAQVIVPFFQELEDKTSNQSHYDFGLRALKSMLNNCGKLKRSVDNVEEVSIIVQSIDETTLPKLIKEDEIVFNELRNKFFYDVEAINFDDEELMSLLKVHCENNGLAFTPAFKKKVLQLNKLQTNHHGIMLVGESGSGKTTCWKSLLKVLEAKTQVEHVNYVIDAKVMKKESLYGSFDPVTREWKDGLLTDILRRINGNLRGEMNKVSWIVFDGDIDPEWAENLNSVLDDNKILTSPNGERIEVHNNVKIIFETDNLKTTTPATISRCGMVWFEKDILDDYSVFESLLFGMELVPVIEDSDSDVEILQIQKSFVGFVKEFINPETLEHIINETLKIEHIMDFNIHRYLNSFNDFLRSYCRKYLHYQIESDKKTMLTDKFVGVSVLLSLIWSFSGDSPLDQRELFATVISNHQCFKNLNIPSVNLIDYDIDIETGEWISWSNKVKFTDLEPHKVAEPNTVVSTTDTVRHESLIRSVLNEHKTLLLCGPPGSGKTMTFLEVLKASPKLDVLQLNFSKDSSPKSLMNSLTQYCEYQKSSNGTIFTPKVSGKWVVVFCDEINLPGVDKYGSQKVISLMRQMIEWKGFWHDKDMQWVTMKNIQFVGACNSPKDPGRQKLSDRFLRHVTLLMVDYPGRSSLEQIYGSFNSAVMKCAPDLKGYTNSVTKAMIDIYCRTKDHLTPQSYAHYIYSPRELTRWTRGLLEAIKVTTYTELGKFLRLWYHEGLRLFHDRLVTDDDRKWTKDLFKEVISETFPFSELEDIMKEPVMFSDWLSQSYEAIERPELYRFINQRLATFSEEEIDVELVLHESFLTHALRIDRVLRQPQGHMILVGASTSGKTTLTKFVSWMNGLKTVQLDVHSKFDIHEFDKCLRDILIRCAKGESICYIIDESSIIETSFIERMNTLLANSEVPGLFEGDDFKSLMNICLEESQNQGLLLDSNDELYKWFTQQISTNLHVVFTITELKDSNRIQVISSPALFNRCVLSYMGDWSPETLFEVGSKKIEELPVDANNYEIPANYESFRRLSSFRDILVDCVIFIHRSIEKTGNYPGKFLQLIDEFISRFNTHQSEMEEVQRHTTNGLNKLRETVLQVARLKEELSHKKKELTKKDLEAGEMLNVMLSEQNEAERKQEFSITAQEELNKQEIEIEERKKHVMKDLAEIEPTILEAKKGVQNIKKQHLTEIRSMTNPPAGVKMTMESVCILVGYQVSSWKDVQLAIRRDDFIPSIVNYNNEEQLTPAIRNYMEETYLSRPDYNFEAVNRASKSCGPLLTWTKAQLTYSSVLQSIGPLREEVKILENGARKTRAQLNALKQMVEDLNASISKYKKDYSSLIRETESIKMEMESVEAKVEKSMKLMNNLTLEKDRWKQTTMKFAETNERIIGNSLLGSAFMVYCGEFDQRDRESLLNQWKGQLDKCSIKYDNALSVVNLLPSELGNSTESSEFVGEDLDELVVENKIIIGTSKIPLIIDPSLQMISSTDTFIKTKKLVVTSFLNESFIKDLENAIRFGGSILIKDSEYYNPIMDSILRHEIQKNGGRLLIKVGDHMIDFDPHFELYLHTADSAIKLSPFIKSRVSVVNFSVSVRNLENQVLNLALRVTKPDIETRRSNLIKLKSEYKGRLKTLELKLLDSISETTGSILDDNRVIEYLDQLKEESHTIDEQMKESDIILETIEQVRNGYNEAATHSSSIFEILKAFSKFSTFYRFSYNDFTDIFANTLKISDTSDVNKLIMDLYKEVYAVISPSLMGTHKVVLGVLLACSYYKQDIGDHFKQFFEGIISIIVNERYTDLGPNFDKIFIQDVSLENLESKVHENIQDQVISKISALVLSLRAGTLNALEFSNGLKEFCSLLFSGTGAYSSKYSIGDFVSHKVTKGKTFILASKQGFDATFKIEQLARAQNQRLQIISLGSKEGTELVKKEIQSISGRGDWLLIQNIQMSPEWLNHLEKIINELTGDSNFRLFLTTNLNCSIPTTLIENSQVLVFENEPTLKSIMLETFKFYDESILTQKTPEFRYIYFLLCWYHSLILARLRYVPVSFTKIHDINESDFQACLMAIDSMVHQGGKTNISPEDIPWDKISLVVGELCYGGKIDNSEDLKYFIDLSSRLFCLQSFSPDFNLIKNPFTNNNKALLKPDGISINTYYQWIHDLPNDIPFSWIELDNNTQDTVILNEQLMICKDILCNIVI
ncbi:dynein heavy chain, cytoplasmic [[Candida] jaroonii]|uniref:Dynein heavy chain, cytoplasmic n=1 Tax=[Candida] jaroonii TaxID=467808 RepID=A0ACA9Y2H2_9ASCO|nr:dynein heavy chain, cytoplasmic [[Candida] jaroonii]